MALNAILIKMKLMEFSQMISKKLGILSFFRI
jgi:hypothetical protein